jgi:replication factor C large subunit
MFEKMHVSSGQAVSMFPYLEIMFQDDELAWEISDFLGFFDEQDEKDTEKLIKVFRKKKIPKKVITKMEKRKAQMRVEERDRRAEELKNQMMGVVEEVPEVETVEEVVEEPVEEEIPEITDIENNNEEIEEKVEKKDKTTQTTLFSF